MKRSKFDRRSEAQLRQAEYDKLSIQQKIERAKSSPGDSKKELAKLHKILNSPKKVKEPTAEPENESRPSIKRGKILSQKKG